jgi:hypothetical protein
MKSKTPITDYIFLVIFGLGAIAVFVVQLNSSTPPTQREAILYSFFEIGLSLGFGWILQRIDSRKQFQENLKQFAWSAHRRITDIEKSVRSMEESISQMRLSYPKDKIHELDILRAIAEGMDNTVVSSKADWAEIIGEELSTKEEIERLQKELQVLKEQQKKSEDKTLTNQHIEEVNRKITTLVSDLPEWLRISSHEWRFEDDSYPREGRLNQTVLDHYLSEATTHSCITIDVDPFVDLTVPENLNRVIQGKPFSIRVDRGMGNQLAFLIDKDGDPIGEIRNPFSTIYSNDFVVSLIAIIGSITKTSSIDGPIDLSKKFVLMFSDFVSNPSPVGDELLLKIPASIADFARG